jgi:hypothetical protein
VRFVLAIICFVLALGTMGTGIAERTFLAGPDQVTLSSTATQKAPVVVIDGAALNAYPETQTVRLAGSSSAFAAYGRTSDVLAWVGNTNYTEVSINKTTGKLQSKLHHGKADKVPNPAGSDLWLQQFTFDQAKDFQVKIPSNMSVIAVSNGKSAAPSTVSLSWPLDNSTPWSGPLILVGGIALILGVIFLLWAFSHLRRTRGPRRTPQRMPKLPKQPRFKSQPRSISVGRSSGKGRRSIRNFVAVGPALGVAAVILVGCSATPPPTIVNTPSSSPKAGQAASSQTPAVTRVQLQKIVSRISATVKTADADFNAKLVATRMAGPALDDRLANYIIRKSHPTLQASIPIPSQLGDYNLPEAKNSWPRSVFTVMKTNSGSNVEFIALMLIQETPRSNYKVNYAMTLQPNTTLPRVAPATVGSTQVDPNIGLFKLQPSAVALAYGQILDQDTAASTYDLFDAKDDAFREQVGIKSKKAQIALLPATAKLTYTNTNGNGQVIALVTINSGAIVAVDLNETETVKPVQAGAAVSVEGAIEAYLGKGTSTVGITATYGDQLLFYVPPSKSSGKIVLLGYSQGLINAKEL